MLPLMLGFQAVDKVRTSIDAMLAVHRLGAAGIDAPAWAHLEHEPELDLHVGATGPVVHHRAVGVARMLPAR